MVILELQTLFQVFKGMIKSTVCACAHMSVAVVVCNGSLQTPNPYPVQETEEGICTKQTSSSMLVSQFYVWEDRYRNRTV